MTYHVNLKSGKLFKSQGNHGARYNGKEGFGMAKTNDSFVPPEVIAISKVQANTEVSACSQKDQDIKNTPNWEKDLTMDGVPKQIWFGANLSKRWEEIKTPLAVVSG